jgi:hypothetical protein
MSPSVPVFLAAVATDSGQRSGSGRPTAVRRDSVLRERTGMDRVVANALPHGRRAVPRVRGALVRPGTADER